jgi:probable rRNA maturation factor
VPGGSAPRGGARRGSERQGARAKRAEPRRGEPRNKPDAPLLEVVDRARPRTPRVFLEKVVREALRHARRPDMPVSLLITGDLEIAKLHRDYLGDATPTDVISFELDGAAELVVSRETAKRVARTHGHTLRAELALYVVHGILHIAGFDDIRPRDRVRMRQAERAIMRRLRLVVHPVDE